jgi:hypothetical protein
VDRMTIGDFARATGLTAGARRLYVPGVGGSTGTGTDRGLSSGQSGA